MSANSWQPMDPLEAMVLKDMLKTELNRRSGKYLDTVPNKINLNGVVSLEFDVDSIEFLINPETNKVIAQSQGQTVIEPLLLIKDFGDLYFAEEEKEIISCKIDDNGMMNYETMNFGNIRGCLSGYCQIKNTATISCDGAS